MSGSMHCLKINILESVSLQNENGQKRYCPENTGYTNYSVLLSRGVGICRFGMAVENLLFLSPCFVVRMTYDGQHGGVNGYGSKNLSRHLDLGDDVCFSM